MRIQGMSGVCPGCKVALGEPNRVGRRRIYCSKKCADRGQDRLVLAQTIDELFAFVDREQTYPVLYTELYN